MAYDSARQSEVTQIAQAEATLKAAQDDLSALKNPSASDLAQAKAAVTQAQANLTALQQGGTDASLASAQAQVTQAQASLDALTATESDTDIAAAQATLVQAQVAVYTAQSNLAQATLAAPFDGVVSEVSAGNDSAISANTTAVTLVDASQLHIDVSLSEPTRPRWRSASR